MSGMIEFDEDAAHRMEAAYTTPDIVAQRARVLSMLALEPGEHVLDVGVGPGLLAAEMAAEVGAGGRVCGIDVSDSMLTLAASRAADPDAATLELAPGGAEEIPYDDGSFDVVVTTQVLEYVPDVPRALAEIHRVLKSGGRVLILDTDWDSLVWHAPDEELMGRVLVAWEEHLADPHLPRTLGRSLALAGFEAGPRPCCRCSTRATPATASAGSCSGSSPASSSTGTASTARPSMPGPPRCGSSTATGSSA